MKTAVDFQTQKLSANLSTTASFNRVITANINVTGNTYMDSTKVGRMTAPTVSKTLRIGGAFKQTYDIMEKVIKYQIAQKYKNLQEN